MRRRSTDGVALTKNPTAPIDLQRVTQGDVVSAEHFQNTSPYQGHFRLATEPMQRGPWEVYHLNHRRIVDGKREKTSGDFQFPSATVIDFRLAADSPFLIPSFGEMPRYMPILPLIEKTAQPQSAFFARFPDPTAPLPLKIIFRSWSQIRGGGLAAHAQPGDTIRLTARMLPEQTTIWSTIKNGERVSISVDSVLEMQGTLIERAGQTRHDLLFSGLINALGWNSTEPDPSTENLAVDPAEVLAFRRQIEHDEAFWRSHQRLVSAQSRRFIPGIPAERPSNDRYRGLDFLLPTSGEAPFIGVRHLTHDWPVFDDHFGRHMPIAPGIFLTDIAAQHLAVEPFANPAMRRQYSGIFDDQILGVIAYNHFHVTSIDSVAWPLPGGVRPGTLLSSILKGVSMERRGDALILRADSAQVFPVTDLRKLHEPDGKQAAAIRGLTLEMPAIFVPAR